MSLRGGRRQATAHRRNDPHLRIGQWLIDGAEAPLPRDVMVHASLCTECRAQIAAFDMLTAMDLGGAGFPPPLAASERHDRRRETRVALAAGGAVAVSAAAVVAGVAATGWRPALGQVPDVSAPPTQQVLGNTGQPQSTVSPIPTRRARASHAAASTSPGVASTPALPSAPAPVTVATPVATQVPTIGARATSTPHSTPTRTPAPTPLPSPATPTSQPTASPSATATPP